MYTTMYYNIEFFVFQPCFINDLMPIKLFVFTCILQEKCSCPCEQIQCLCLKKSLLCHDYVQWCGVNCAEEESVEHDVQRNLKFKCGSKPNMNEFPCTSCCVCFVVICWFDWMLLYLSFMHIAAYGYVAIAAEWLALHHVNFHSNRMGTIVAKFEKLRFELFFT